MRSNMDHHPSRGLAVDIISSIDGNAMLDVMLMANDGGEIPASRFVLGARSPVLQQLLFKKGQSSHEHKLDYSTTVVNALVHYCRTNELLEPQSKDEAAARETVKLCECAVTFQLNGLVTLVDNLAAFICKTHAYLACAMYDECTIRGKAVDSVQHIALGVIRKNPQSAFLRNGEVGNHRFCGSGAGSTTIPPAGVSFLQPATLQQLLMDPNMCTEEVTLFRAILLWADASSIHNNRRDAWMTQQVLQERRAAAKRIVSQSIDLSKIAPSDLLGVVSDSGLVEEVDVSNALIQLAVRVEKEGVEVSKSRAGVQKKEVLALPPIPPTPPRQLVYSPHMEDANSVIEDDDDLPVNTSNISYETVEHSNKRKPKKQQPKAVTPQKKPTPNFATPPRDSGSVVSKTTAAAAEKKRRKRGGVGSELRKAVGMFLRDKVDSLCIHPKYSEAATKND